MRNVINCLFGLWGALWLSCALTGCSGPGGAPIPPPPIIVPRGAVSMLPAAWVISFSPTMPVHPSGIGSGWYFDFPSSAGSVNYVMVPFGANTFPTKVSFTYKISALVGNPQFVSIEQAPPVANFRVMLERQGDTLSASQEFYRWWSNPDHVDLVADGLIHNVNIPITPDRWSSVFGKFGTAAPVDLRDALLNLAGVGFTFGGGNAFGHGVYVTGGAARFELLDFKVT